MLSVGVDFGSTYTMVSVYRKDVDRAEAVALTEDAGTAAIPTVLATSRGRVSIGREAKKKRPPAVSYRAFKMMLAEDNKEILESRGFDDEHTPAEITAMFLESVLSQILEREDEKKIDHLAIGAPEIWTREMEEIERDGRKFSRFSTNVDGRAKLRDICKKLPMVKSADSVQVVSEPVSASSFFAYDFFKKNGKNFDGHILLIDYGGGTLDITLTEISPKSYGDGSVGMEVRAPFKTGAGENRERGKIGQAGIVYMESLTRAAIKMACPKIEVPNDPTFYRAVDALEEAILNGKTELDAVFSSVGADPDLLSEEDMDDAGEEFIFTEIMYGKEDVPISYQLMAEVYNEVIKPVFAAKMDEAIAYMNNPEHLIEYDERNVDKFKIVLAGGFGNFYLVKKQVADKFRFSSQDKRKEYVMGNTANGEKAVSMGAALIAADKIRIRNTAPFSIGVAAKNLDGKYIKAFGLKYNQDIEFNKEYRQKDDAGNDQIIVSSGGYIDKLLINMQEDDRATLVMIPKPEFTKKLSRAIKNPSQAAVVGFSLDSSGVISLHIHQLDIIENKVSKEKHTIELTSFNELFGVQQMERAFPND